MLGSSRRSVSSFLLTPHRMVLAEGNPNTRIHAFYRSTHTHSAPAADSEVGVNPSERFEAFERISRSIHALQATCRTDRRKGPTAGPAVTLTPATLVHPDDHFVRFPSPTTHPLTPHDTSPGSRISRRARRLHTYRDRGLDS